MVTFSGSQPPANVLQFSEPECRDLSLVGGKGASLGELASEELPVPPGFCVSTQAFSDFVRSIPTLGEQLAKLQELSADDTEAIRSAAYDLRESLLSHPVPASTSRAIIDAHDQLGGVRVAVRSSGTLEDLDSASFAGQHDTFLEVTADTLIEKVRACWASLYTERAVAYRRQRDVDERRALMAVVVQKMAEADCAGVLFTVDPLSGRRDVAVVDSSWGLGEAVVSGIVNPDNYRVKKDTLDLLEVKLGDKAIEICPKEGGGVEHLDVDEARRKEKTLADEAVRRLVRLGTRLEELKGAPQDIEWCVRGDAVYLLQSRPITSLYPIPPCEDDGLLRAYLCFGHQQANPAAWSPFACGLVAFLAPFGRDKSGRSRYLVEAGHRVYLDATALLLKYPFRRMLSRIAEEISPDISRRLTVVRDRSDFKRGHERVRHPGGTAATTLFRVLSRTWLRFFITRPERARLDWDAFIQTTSASIDERLQQATSATDKIRVITSVIGDVFDFMMVKFAAPILVSGMLSLRFLGALMRGRVADETVMTLSRCLDGNIVTTMDLRLGDLADTLRDEPALVEALERSPAEIEAILADNPTSVFARGWREFLKSYGHRAPGEIDIAVPRWSESPESLVQILLGMVRAEPGAHRARHEEGVRASSEAEREILAKAGTVRRKIARFLIRRIRGYLAMREHHKFLFIVLLGKFRRAILEVGAEAVQRGLLEAPEDAFMLDPLELIDALDAEANRSVAALVSSRREDHARFAELFPPAVMLSSGEIPALPPRTDLPDGALAGTPVSSGVVEGTAKVLRDPASAILHPGEILVAPFTDAAWTTLFSHAGGVVLEAGGVMSHGSVIAREYGIPGVIAAEATRAIKSGDRIRVDGNRGIVEILS